MKNLLLFFLTSLAVAASGQSTSPQAQAKAPQANSRNVIVITSDGLRWQEVFRGMDKDMLTTENQVKKKKPLVDQFGGKTAEIRRKKLMPFFWNHVVKNGIIYGNRDKGSVAHVTNNMWFSYPGYNEMMTGKPDDERVNSNKPIPNPNVSVLEWLAKKPGIDGKCAVFASWGVHSSIFNEERCGFPVDAGGRQFHPPTGLTCGMEMVNRIRPTVPFRWNNEEFDGLMWPMATEYIRTQKPRVTFISFIETDAFGHEGNYPGYLDAAHRVDGFIKELWELTQSIPEYKDNTTFIFTVDHGRGDKTEGPAEWNHHKRSVVGSDAIFLAIWGPDTPALGEMTTGTITQSQVAATTAEALGFTNFNAENPGTAKPIDGVFKK